jgi:hypothetical protein
MPTDLANIGVRVRGGQPDCAFYFSCTRISLEVRRIEALHARKETFYRDQAKGDGLLTKGAKEVGQKGDELRLVNDCLYGCLRSRDEDFVWAGANG